MIDIKENNISHVDNENPVGKHIQGRKYISHGYCTDDDSYWVPHNITIDPIYTNSGPDWNSKIRYIPEPRNENQKNEELWPDNSSHIRTYPRLLYNNYFVWNPNFQNIGIEKGKKCLFNNIHLKSKYSADEITDKSRFGSKRKLPDIDSKNGFHYLEIRDKLHNGVEYSPEFFKDGVSIPIVPFGRPSRINHDTLIPTCCFKRGSDYNSKRNWIVKEEEIKDVENLENWKPSQNIMDMLYSNPVQLKTKIN